MLERNWYNTRDGRGGRLREPIEYGECPIWSEDPSLAERMSTEDICEMYWCARCVLLEDEAFWQRSRSAAPRRSRGAWPWELARLQSPGAGAASRLARPRWMRADSRAVQRS